MIDLTVRQQLIDMYSDMYKDAYGFRPRGHNLSDLSESEIQDELDMLSNIISNNIREREEYESRQLAVFNKKIEETIKMGAGDRKTALRWLLEAYDDSDLCYGADCIFYDLGIGYNNVELANEINVAINEIMKDRNEKMV